MWFTSHNTTKNHHQKTVHFEPESPVQFAPEWGVHFKPELGVQFEPEYPAERVKSLRNGETETYFLKVVNFPEREQQAKILPSSEWQKLGIEYYATFYCARVRDSTKSDFKT